MEGQSGHFLLWCLRRSRREPYFRSGAGQFVWIGRLKESAAPAAKGRHSEGGWEKRTKTPIACCSASFLPRDTRRICFALHFRSFFHLRLAAAEEQQGRKIKRGEVRETVSISIALHCMRMIFLSKEKLSFAFASSTVQCNMDGFVYSSCDCLASSICACALPLCPVQKLFLLLLLYQLLLTLAFTPMQEGKERAWRRRE